MVLICGLSVLLACAATLVAQLLTWLIGFITNLAFYGRISGEFTSPAGNHLGWWVVGVPVVGAVIVGFMARYGSEGIRGHGIPEAMDNVLTRESRIPPRLTFLKPLSAAIAIGTGGPFGAEGPIIATGGALGSLVGQLLRVTAVERKTLLAAGAAAGMAATFGSPVAAVLLAVELLLFEFRPRSFLPVALATFVAAGLRFIFHAPYPVFPMPDLHRPTEAALLAYILIGAAIGVASVFVTKAVYAVEDAFDHLPIHWMWWPAIGAVAVGVIGYFAPRTLGVGYDNITGLISASFPVRVMLVLCVLKFVSWAIALGSGTSGGTLAPLFTIGSALGGLMGVAIAQFFPQAGIDVRVAALVGMAAMFTGASRALLTSVVFAFETTNQPYGLLPLLGGCAVAYFVSSMLMRETIMTAKVAKRGVRVPSEYGTDFLDALHVRDVATRSLVTLKASQTLAEVRTWLMSHVAGSHHQGYPVVDESGALVGVLTRRDLLNGGNPPARELRTLLSRKPLTVWPDNTLREAADVMVNNDVGRLIVVDQNDASRLVGILTRGDVLSAHRHRLREAQLTEPAFRLPGLGRRQEQSGQTNGNGLNGSGGGPPQ
ncbi:MAG: chloride channel protein [Phycisphaerales bacterium]|nr:chloride channel protein [Phycisphaerales bacterium]